MTPSSRDLAPVAQCVVVAAPPGSAVVDSGVVLAGWGVAARAVSSVFPHVGLHALGGAMLVQGAPLQA